MPGKFKSLGESLRELGFEIPTTFDAPPTDPNEPTVNCRRCRDIGYVSKRTDRWHSDVVECPCGLVLQRRVDKLFRSSPLSDEMRTWTLESYADISGRHRLVAAIRTMWDATNRWMLLTGPVGVGKSGIAVSLLNERLARHEGGLFVVAPALLQRIRATYGDDEDGNESAVMDALIQTPLLVLDDVGKVKLTEWGQEKLYTLISERFSAKRRTIVTSNYSTTDGSLEGHLWPATFDRLRGASDLIEMSGDSLR
jgi:DNA replication protein DnaC